MTIVKRFFLICFILAISMLYKKMDQHLGALPVPKLDPNEWWGDGPAPSDYQQYLVNNSDVINNRLMYPDSVRYDTLNYIYHYKDFMQNLDHRRFVCSIESVLALDGTSRRN